MNGVSTLRLYILRAGYLLIFVGLALMIGPLIADPPQDLEHMRGVVWSLLSGIGLLAALGIRYPLQMIPLLLLELVWKTIWLIQIGIPMRMNNTLTGPFAQSWVDCVVGVVICLVVIPWPYVFANYVKRPGAPWRVQTARNRAAVPGV